MEAVAVLIKPVQVVRWAHRPTMAVDHRNSGGVTVRMEAQTFYAPSTTRRAAEHAALLTIIIMHQSAAAKTSRQHWAVAPAALPV